MTVSPRVSPTRLSTLTSLLSAAVLSGCSSTAPRHDMVFVEGAEYEMGCTTEQEPACLSHETRTRATVSDFWIARFETTNAQFAEFLNAKGNQLEARRTWYEVNEYARIESSDGRFVATAGFEDLPVTNVTWYGAVAYSRWLSGAEGETYRLPTEAEWEYAARGGLKQARSMYSGGDALEQLAWCDDFAENSPTGWTFKNGNGVHPVGQKEPNELGLHDMSGNVREWTLDLYENRLDGGDNPRGADYGSLRVSRGGSWDSNSDDCRVSARTANNPLNRFGVADGFRVVRVEDES